MMRFSRALLAPVVKRSTGLVGVDVVPDARNQLIKLYEKTLQDIKVIPEHATYRKVVEEFTSQRLAVVKQHEDLTRIEDEIGFGQAEELIIAAKNELELIPQYASWKLWELKRPAPNDDIYDELYEDLENMDPDSISDSGLRNLAAKAREESAKRKAKAAADAAEAATKPAAAALGAAPAGKP